MLTIALLSTFILVSIAVGIWGMRKTTSLGDFFLGGRSLGPWISAVAYGTTYFSAVMFIGFAGKLGWGFGLSVMWIAVGNVLFGCLLSWLVLGRRTRRMTQNLDVMTMPEFFGERYNSLFLKLATSLIIFVFLLPYSASVFKGLGHLFEMQFHMPYNTALLIMVGITGIYLVMGGYFAVTLNDFIQGIIMVIGTILMVSIITGNAGGLTNAIATASIKYHEHVPVGKGPSGLLLTALVFMTSFGAWGMPQMVQKFYSIKDEKMILRAAVVVTLFATIIVCSAYFVGALTHVFIDSIPKIAGKPVPDLLVPTVLMQQLPPALMAVILLLVLSASMSTLASLVLVSASSVAIDLYKGHINQSVSKKHSLLMMRFFSAAFVALSYLVARNEFSVIVTLMSLSWGAVAGAFLAPYFYGLFWKRTSRLAVEIGACSGLLVSIAFFFILGPANSPIAASLGMLVPFAVIPVITMFTPAPEKELIDRAFGGIIQKVESMQRQPHERDAVLEQNTRNN